LGRGVAMASEGLVGLADAGYASGDQLKEYGDRGMEMYVPLPDNTIRKAIIYLFRHFPKKHLNPRSNVHIASRNFPFSRYPQNDAKVIMKHPSKKN